MRRDGSRSRAIVGASIALGLSLALAQTARSQSAPPAAVVPSAQFAMDARHTGRSSFVGPRSQPAIQWRVRARRRVFGAPALGEDGTVVFAGVDGVVHAVDGRTGVERWAYAAPGGVFASPALTAELAIIGHGGGAFVAIDRRGAVRWRFVTEEDADASPTLALDGTVIVASRGVAALDPRTGLARWRASGARVLGGAAVSTDGSIVSSDVEGNLRWLRASDGGEIRRARVGSLVEGSPMVADDGAVIVGAEDGHVRRFSAQGALVWDVALGGPVRTTPALGRDGLIIVGSDDLHVHGLDGGTGARRWSVRTGGFIRASARIDREGWIYVGSEDDRLLAIDPAGRLAWSVTLGADIDSSALLVRDGAIAVGCDDGGLYLLSDR